LVEELFKGRLRASLLHTDIAGGMEYKAKEISYLSPLHVQRRHFCQHNYFLPQTKIKKLPTRSKRSPTN
jgi:hypothetical protein